MTRSNHRSVAAAAARMKCAIYTRKSTEDGLEQEFNSLDAQRESGEAYIKSQAQEGWDCLPDFYDDGGFTGGNMDRPALRRLIADIESGKVQCVVVYKVDRLSRSLLDFARLLEVFERHRVAFVSVTQQFNTANSMGRLMLNVLLSFAQFEREIISERTRDKIAAARRKGKWSGGMPLLGYDVDPRGSKLIINDDEAAQVRAIFERYLDEESLIATVAELDRRGWTNKRWTTRKGNVRGGLPFTKTSLFKLLTNVTYLGKVKYKDEVHKGEHAAIVREEVWQRVQALLKRNGRTGGAAVRNQFGAILKGVLRCAACDCAMTPSHTTRKGTKRYRYYVCTNAQKRGWGKCPTKSIPAPEIERFVVEQIKGVGHDHEFLQEIISKTRTQAESRLAGLETELRHLERDVAHWNGEVRRLVAQVRPDETESPAVARLADLQDRLQGAERRATEVREQIVAINKQAVQPSDVEKAMATFDPIWETLTLREQARVIQLLVDRIDYDGATGKVKITFHPTGIQSLANDAIASPSEDAA